MGDVEKKEVDEIRVLLNEVLTKDGEKERLKEMLTTLLIENGWKEEVNLLCRRVIQERGVDNTTVEDIVREITPAARAKVPDEVKKALLEKIKTVLLKEIDDRANGK